MGLLPDLPIEEQDPWFDDRQAFDLAVRNEIENLLASKVYVDAAIAALVNSSPAALDTLNELANALGDDPNFATTVMNQLAQKAALVHTHVPSAITKNPGFKVLAGYSAETTFGEISAAESSTPSSFMWRGTTGTAEVENPIDAKDIANKQYVDGAVSGVGGGGADGAGQSAPEVNSFFTSAWFQSIGTSQLRDRATSKMPLQLMEDISIDQAAFNLTVLAGTAGQTATIRLYELTGTTWTQLEILGSGIPLTDTTGDKVVSFTPIPLTAGVIYGFTLYEEQAYDSTVRVSQGALTGPGFGLGSGYGTGGQLLPVGSNASLIPANGIPVIKVRRSS